MYLAYNRRLTVNSNKESIFVANYRNQTEFRDCYGYGYGYVLKHDDVPAKDKNNWG